MLPPYKAIQGDLRLPSHQFYPFSGPRIERPFSGIAERGRPKLSENRRKHARSALASTNCTCKKPRGEEVRDKSCQDAKSRNGEPEHIVSNMPLNVPSALKREKSQRWINISTRKSALFQMFGLSRNKIMTEILTSKL